MVQIDVLIKDIETDPTAQMITLIVEASAEGHIEELRVGEMIGNLQDMSDDEIRQHFRDIFTDVGRQMIGRWKEVNVDLKAWKRAETFIGDRYSLDIDVKPVPPAPTIDSIMPAIFLREAMNVWKIEVRTEAEGRIPRQRIVVTKSSVEEALGRR